MTYKRTFLCCLLMLSLSLIGCSRRERTTNGHGLHEAKYVTVNGGRLQYLDWGGSGCAPGTSRRLL